MRSACDSDKRGDAAYNLQIEVSILDLQMIRRDAASTLTRLAKGFPILAITGPRQAGKTTLAKSVFTGKPYVTLENPDEREFAQNDPKRFLARFPQGAILDEVQRTPQLLSWLQGWVDERKIMGDFVLTGSAQFDLIESITQTLAGRVAFSRPNWTLSPRQTGQPVQSKPNTRSTANWTVSPRQTGHP